MPISKTSKGETFKQGRIPVEMFYTPDGERTCALDIPGGEFCPYFRTQKFGTEDTCLFAPEDYHGRCQTLERRGEVGYTIVGDWCPITEVV